MKTKQSLSRAKEWTLKATAGVIVVGALGASIVSANRGVDLPGRIFLKDVVPVSITDDDRAFEHQDDFAVIPDLILRVGESPFDSPEAASQYEVREDSPFDSPNVSDSVASPFDSPDVSDSVASPFDSPDVSDSVASPFDSPDDSDSVASPFDSPDDSDSVASFDSPDDSDSVASFYSPDDSDSFDSPDNS